METVQTAGISIDYLYTKLFLDVHIFGMIPQVSQAALDAISMQPFVERFNILIIYRYVAPDMTLFISTMVKIIKFTIYNTLNIHCIQIYRWKGARSLSRPDLLPGKLLIP